MKDMNLKHNSSYFVHLLLQNYAATKLIDYIDFHFEIILNDVKYFDWIHTEWMYIVFKCEKYSIRFEMIRWFGISQ